MNPQRGFTLLEVVVGMAVMAVISFFTLQLQRDIIVLNGIAQAGFSAQDDARRAFKKMTLELRTLAYAENGSYPIAAATVSSVTFYSDVDNDGQTERVRYFLSGSTLQRGVIEPAGTPATYAGTETLTVLANDLSYPSGGPFSYYDASYDGTTAALALPAQLSVIRMIGITLTIDKNGSRQPGPQTYSSQVALRNLKDNL